MGFVEIVLSFALFGVFKYLLLWGLLYEGSLNCSMSDGKITCEPALFVEGFCTGTSFSIAEK